MASSAGGPTPVEIQIGVLLRTLEMAQREGRARFTVADLLAALGSTSHVLVITVFSVLNMIPGPPGYGGTVAAAIIGFSIAMIAGASLTLPDWIGNRRLPVRVLIRMAGLLVRIAGIAGRFSRPRLAVLSEPAMQPLLGVFIVVVSLPMLLPIPFINAVPNVGICILCLGWINRDALPMVLGVVVALIGMGIAGVAVWSAYHLARTALGAAP